MYTPILADVMGVPTPVFVFAVIIILVALAFDYTNGFHDAANSIATIVSTRVLSPRTAVMFAAFFNFVAFFWGSEAVAKTIGSGMVDVTKVGEEHLRLWVLLCGLIGAITWNLITWYYGIPSSSSHALVGGYAGAAIAAGGFATIVASGWTKTLIFIVVSPVVGLTFGFLIMVAVLWIFRKWAPGRVDTFFRKGQIVSSALISFSHGGNDAQKTMGMIAGVLAASGIEPNATTHIPGWVSFACYLTIALGTMSGGWRIVHTMGSKITKLKPVGGFSAETGAAAAISLATHFGIPVSTTHTISGAIMGVGATRRLSAVRWGVAGTIIWAWVLTIPAAAIIAAVSFLICNIFV
jgi:inorganic phosphate transporter, PiT family